MCFSQAGAAVNKQRIIIFGWLFGYGNGSGMGKLITCTNHEPVKVIVIIKKRKIFTSTARRAGSAGLCRGVRLCPLAPPGALPYYVIDMIIKDSLAARRAGQGSRGDTAHGRSYSTRSVQIERRSHGGQRRAGARSPSPRQGA